MQKEEGGQSLLAVEWLQCAVRLELAIDEVEADGVRVGSGDSTAERTEETVADLVDLLTTASLGVIALDERDLDASDDRPV